VTTLQDVIAARQTAAELKEQHRQAEERYRETVRAALADGVAQADIARALGLTREMIRRDAMTDEQREQFRRTQAERGRARRRQS